MSRRWIVVVFAAVLGMQIAGENGSAQILHPDQEDEREISRLLSIVKKAPQPEYRKHALVELERKGISRLQLVFALTLDEWLLDADPIVRYRASARLGEMQSPAKLLAVTNLRNLIAAETNPELVWMHAVTLSSIALELGNALELIVEFDEDPILRNTLGLDKPNALPISRSENHRPISEISLTWHEHQRLTDSLRVTRLGKPGIGPFFAAPAPFFPTPSDLPAQKGIDLRPAIAEKKRQPHSLVASRQFDEILEQMDQGSPDAWEIFRWDGAEFPASSTARHLVTRAFESDWQERHRAIEALWYAGPDAELAAAVCYAVMRDLCIPHQVEMIARIERPREYSIEVLKRIRHHADPKVRAAATLALGRMGMLDEELLEMLLVASRDENPDLRVAAVGSAAKHRAEHAKLQTMLETALLEDPHPAVVAEASLGLSGVIPAADFRQTVFECIELEKPAERNLVLIGYLLNHSDPNSECAAKLLGLQDAMQSLFVWETIKPLPDDLREMIEEAQSIKRQMSQEQLEQLEKLKLLLD